MKKLSLLFVCLNYQILFSQTATAPSAGDGTSGNPYKIASLENLYWIAESSARWSYHYIQTADIDATSTATWFSDGSGGFYGWTPIGNWTNKFTGSYNGDGHTIDGLYDNRTGSDYQGLFGVTSGSNITNLGVTNVNINGYLRIGGIVGCTLANSIIEKCYSTGNLSGSNFIGGLVGNNRYSTVSNSYSRGNSTGICEIGGLVGENVNSTVTNCYSIGGANGTWATGGLVGLNYNTTMNNSYSIGSVNGGAYTGGLVGYNDNSSANNCFWNTETSGQSSSASGIGKTIVEMKTNSTFLDAGYDPEIWNIGDGINDGYPYLKWQNPSGTPLPVELTSFTALVNNDQVNLNWQTETEVNNYGFEIERASASPSQGWEKIGFVEGHGNSNSLKDYYFNDLNLESGKYKYRLKLIDNDGSFDYSDVVEAEIEQSREFTVSQNFPNPFNPETAIKYSIPQNQKVTLIVYDVLGVEVRTLVNEEKSAGYYEVNFDAANLASGVYYYKLQTGNFVETKKMILLR